MDVIDLPFLERRLPGSSGSDRQRWARHLHQQGTDIRAFFPLFDAPYPVRSRWLWMISDWGEADPGRLTLILPDLLEWSQTAERTALKYALPRLWLIAGIPPEQEGHALDLLFELLEDPDILVSQRYNALRALARLVEPYPELREEFILTVQHLLGRYTPAFDRGARKLIRLLS